MKTTVRNSYTPKAGEYCNTIVVDNDKKMQYIFDSDGVYTTYASKQQEGAPMFYVDSSISAAKRETKEYTDEAVSGIETRTKNYTDEQVAAALEEAKEYADREGTSKEYVDGQDAITLQDAKDYTDGEISDLHTTIQGEISAATGELSPVAASGSYNDLTDKPTIPVITLSSVDLGEGAALAANHYYAVYDSGEESE